MNKKNLKFIIIYLILILYPGCIFGMSNTIEVKLKTIFEKYNGENIIYINKKDFTLYLYNRDLDIIVKYKIGYLRHIALLFYQDLIHNRFYI